MFVHSASKVIGYTTIYDRIVRVRHEIDTIFPANSHFEQLLFYMSLRGVLGFAEAASQ
jgi:hypothetical protein